MKKYQTILKAIKDFFDIPDICKGCGRRTIAEKRAICPYDHCWMVR